MNWQRIAGVLHKSAFHCQFEVSQLIDIHWFNHVLQFQSPSFTRFPNFRQNITDIANQHDPESPGRPSFSLGALLSTGLVEKNAPLPLKTNSDINSSDGINDSPSSHRDVPSVQLSTEIKLRIRDLSAKTRAKTSGDGNEANNSSQITGESAVVTKETARKLAEITRNSTRRIKEDSRRSTRSTRSHSMAVQDGSGCRKLNANHYVAQPNRRLPGLTTGPANEDSPFFQSITIPHIDDEGYLNSHELNFLRFSAEGDLLELKRIFEEQAYYLFHLDVNCVDSLDRTALSLALLNRHIDVVKFLLSDEVVGIELRDALFYAIECEFYEAIGMVLEKDPQTSAQISPGTTSPFEPGLTPFMLAANKNNYQILSTLYNYNHCLTVSDKEILDESCDSYSWDAVMERLLHFRARASPAFMLLLYNEKGLAWDPLNTAMDLFGELQLLAKREREVDEAYLQMAEQCETFALQLLQEVRSASELADLMRYDLDDDPDEDDDPGETDRVIIRTRQKMRNYLKPIEKAIKYKMKDFVTSDNSQLALIYIQKGSLFRKLRGIKAFAAQALLGIMFPLLSIAFLIAPDSKFGQLMRNPTVKFACNVVTELVFVFMLLANTILTQYGSADEREKIPPLLIVAYVWIIGKFVQEVREISHQGVRGYLSDVWNWNDIFTILLFTCYMGLRTLNSVVKAENKNHVWKPLVLNPIPLSDVCISIAYILIHLRILELLRADRRFGPLQVSLDLMARDATRFFVIFFIIYLAFGSGITELYAPFGKEKNCSCVGDCEISISTTPTSAGSISSFVTTSGEANVASLHPGTAAQDACMIPCKTDMSEDSLALSKSIFSSLYVMFWTMFGYGNPTKWTQLNEQCLNYKGTEVVGTFIIWTYHIIAIVVLVNMLIAMMSNSFQKTHDDAEREWKFHRTQLWLKFIRNEISQPPPMNLIPRPKQIRRLAAAIAKKFRTCGHRENTTTVEDSRLQNEIRMHRRRTGFDSNKMGETLAGALYEGETRYSKVLRLVVIRYLKKKVLTNEMVI